MKASQHHWRLHSYGCHHPREKSYYLTNSLPGCGRGSPEGGMPPLSASPPVAPAGMWTSRIYHSSLILLTFYQLLSNIFLPTFLLLLVLLTLLHFHQFLALPLPHLPSLTPRHTKIFPPPSNCLAKDAPGEFLFHGCSERSCWVLLPSPWHTLSKG